MATALTRWNPTQDMWPLRDAMQQLFESSTVAPNVFGSSLPLDVYAEDDAFVIEAALPGLAPDAVNVSILGNQVTIGGEYPPSPAERQYLFRERRSGRFERTIMLPSDLDPNQAEAHYEHGLLRLRVPQAESTKPKRITVSTNKELAAGQ